MILTDQGRKVMEDAGIPMLQRGWDTHEFLLHIPHEFIRCGVKMRLNMNYTDEGWHVHYTPEAKTLAKMKAAVKETFNTYVKYLVGWKRDSLADALAIVLVKLQEDRLISIP